jgi:hypothetical protein
MALRKKKQEAAAPPAPITLDIPIIPTDIAVGRLDVGEVAYAVLQMQTLLCSATFVVDRSQAINLGSQLLKLAEKMPREQKLTLPKNADAGLVIVEDQ